MICLFIIFDFQAIVLILPFLCSEFPGCLVFQIPRTCWAPAAWTGLSSRTFRSHVSALCSAARWPAFCLHSAPAWRLAHDLASSLRLFVAAGFFPFCFFSVTLVGPAEVGHLDTFVPSALQNWKALLFSGDCHHHPPLVNMQTLTWPQALSHHIWSPRLVNATY